ncbi:squalene synthase HpnD [Rhodothalassium salexigens]|uniref:presqualene diphosphate synthase HpnD n=1 Tax=Rhodothalassium salexigens TaxID=1086 RepID=UPI001914292C|nr:presqualene diphosphate synthase HpnD [Rhodothalassium salexigens]MBK5911685.1 squalene synthase HpnD [Rhodothalassium salexigens]MBK5919726.1 squalene synthase HpnD [Rhodothalassium salexigens]
MTETQAIRSEPPAARSTPTADSADWAHVYAVVGEAGTSFFWAMRLLPKPQRRAMFAVYAFCREVDDIADGDLATEEKHQALDLWRADIAAIFDGREPAYPTARALADVVAAYDLAQADLDAMVDGMAMDADGPIRAPSLDRLDLYCDRVAAAVGRMSVPIFGEPGANGQAVATHLGRALQLTNILRDVHEDALEGRLYLPREVLARHGIDTSDPYAVAADPRLPTVARDIGAMAAQSFDRADAAMARCDRVAMKPARMMRAVYRHLLDHMAAEGFTGVGKPKPGNPLAKIRSSAVKLWLALRHGLLARP